MKVPMSWLSEYVDPGVPLLELAHKLTLAGLEVESIEYVGLAPPDQAETAVSGLGWDPEKIVVAEIREVMPHPDADRLVLCRVFDGKEEHTVLTGAPNLFGFKAAGPLEQPLKVAYARQGARLYDGHQAGRQVMELKPATIRGFQSSSMVCSEKELGISDEHEGIIVLDDEAVPGTPLVDYMGDAVLDIAITPNIARAASVYGVAREVAAVFDVELQAPDLSLPATGEPIAGRVRLQIEAPELNPRFVLGLLENVTIGPSPYWVQRRLRLAGVRPINNIVDATNYAMIELGEPLHAFDFDILRKRAGGDPPVILTRTAHKAERLTTLDGLERELEPFTVLVTDNAGPLSIGGVMGGLESEVHEGTVNVLLEGAAWQFINIRRSLSALKMDSEAAYRFSRGVHPSLAEAGVRRGLQLMHSWAGGELAQGLLDEYPLPPQTAQVEFEMSEVERWLGIRLAPEEVQSLLERLAFAVEVDGERVRVTAPDHRLDIGTGLVGMSDVMEELARVYGYDRIPVRLFDDEIPSQPADEQLAREQDLADLLVRLGLQEVVSYRLTTPEREARRLPPGEPADDRDYVRLANPSSSEREVMRHSLLASLLETVEANAKVSQRIAIFEMGPVYLPQAGERLPQEQPRLGIALHGRRLKPSWSREAQGLYDFFDLKGVLEAIGRGLRLPNVTFERGEHASYHPGKTAVWLANGVKLGAFGELHPMVAEAYRFNEAPVVAGSFDLSAMLAAAPDGFDVVSVPPFPPVLEDLALIVKDDIPAAQVESVLRSAGAELVTQVELFDLYHGDQIGHGRKSLAYAITYQAPDRTLTDEEVAAVRRKMVAAAEKEVGAELRGEE